MKIDWTTIFNLAKRNGFDLKAHQNALLLGDEDQITLTHPANFLSEEEVETYFTRRP